MARRKSVFHSDAAKATFAQVIAQAKQSGSLPGLARREDNGLVLGFARAFEAIEAQTYKYLYSSIRWRNLFPIKTVPSWADESTYRMLDKTGKARVITDMSSDLPSLGVVGDETKQPLRTLGLAFSYSLDDLAKSVYLGEPIDAFAAIAAREELERLADELCAVGGAGSGTNVIPSFVGNTNINSVAATAVWYDRSDAATVTATAWRSIMGDVSKAIAVANNATYNAFDNSMVLALPTVVYNWAMTTIVMDTGFVGSTVADMLLKGIPQLEAIELWPQLDTRDSGAPLPLVYPRDPRVLNAVVGQDFTMLPPEARNLGFRVNCKMKFGGIELKYPKAVTKITGTTQA